MHPLTAEAVKGSEVGIRRTMQGRRSEFGGRTDRISCDVPKARAIERKRSKTRSVFLHLCEAKISPIPKEWISPVEDGFHRHEVSISLSEFSKS